MRSRASIIFNLSPLPNRNLMNSEEKRVIVLVGLPARGKTFISKRLTRYLNWIGVKTRVFNVGDYRRKATDSYIGHEFFSEKNEKACQIRKQAAEDALTDMIDWLQNGDGYVAVFDATNSTRSRRDRILEVCSPYNFEVLFVESICDDPKIVRESIIEVKVKNPDYVSMDITKAVEDFLNRIQHYEDQYQPIDDQLDKDLHYVKIFNQGQRYLVNRLEGNLNCRIIYYIMNMRVCNKTFYITRHGESELNVKGRLGGDANLSPRGEEYAKKLAKYIESEERPELVVWTSHMRRTRQTAQSIPCARREAWKALDELDAGDCEMLTYEEIQDRFPEDFAKRDADKYHYRYPMGESYQDVVARLEPIIMELGHQRCVLLVCHQAVARCLLAYFLDYKQNDLPYIKVPLHRVYKLTPTAYGCLEEYIDLDVPAVDTHREKPCV